MRKVLWGVLAAILLAIAASVTLEAVGTATTVEAVLVNTQRLRLTRYTTSWTSTAGGAVSGNAFTIARGRLLSMRFVPGAGGAQPSDQYDLTLTDSDGVDLAFAAGANLSNATPTIYRWDPPLLLDGSKTVDVVIANAGNAKSGTVVILVEN